MNKIKIASAIFKISILYWIIYNTYYGWNLKPINETEGTLDLIFRVLMYLGIGFYLSPLLKSYEDKFKDK